MKKILFLILFFKGFLFSDQASLFLEGYLGDETLFLAQEQLSNYKETDGATLLLQISSSSGDIRQVLSFAQEIYRVKANNHLNVVVFVNEKAVGPAAMLLFLADELIVTPSVSWGDIPFGAREEMPQPQLVSAVKSLIDQNKSNSSTLTKLVDAMVDPYYQLIYQNGERVIEKEGRASFDPVVIHVDGMRSLGVDFTVMEHKAFVENYFLDNERKSDHFKKISKAEFKQKFDKYVTYSQTEENLIGYLHIGNERSIDQATYIYIKFALKDFVKKGVRFIFLDLNTPGGEVLSTLKIVDLLQKVDLQYHIPVVAFINNWAVSAGAMIAYSCRFIGVEANSLMGAAEPVIAGGGGQMITASEKINSALRAEFFNLASFYGRDPLLAEAMVDKDLILVLRNDKLMKLSSESEIIKTGPSLDLVISEKGKLVTLNAKEMVDLGVADFEVPYKDISAMENKKLDTQEKLVFQEPLFNKIPFAKIIEYQNWRVRFFTVLTHPVIASLLFIGLVLGLYIEINTPGFGVPGSIALGCLCLILLSSFASHAINWIEIIILCIGLLLLALELFIIPGFGITGIFGIVLTIIGLFTLMLPGIDRINFLEPETFHLVGLAFIERLAWLFGSLVFSIILIILMARFFSTHFFRFSKLVLKGEQDKEDGFVSGIPKESMPKIGDFGETVSPLKPFGKVHIGENLFDAVALDGYLETHNIVEVVEIEGNKVVVKKIKKKEEEPC